MTRTTRELLALAALMGAILARGVGVYLRAQHQAAAAFPRSPKQQKRALILAADELTGMFHVHPLDEYRITAYASGQDCTTLLLTSTIVLDDNMVEDLHFGGGVPAYRNGVMGFALARGFSRVKYVDTWGKTWLGHLDGAGVVPFNREHFSAEQAEGGAVCGEYERGGH